jgi:hypothetical protein
MQDSVSLVANRSSLLAGDAPVAVVGWLEVSSMHVGHHAIAGLGDGSRSEGPTHLSSAVWGGPGSAMPPVLAPGCLLGG